MPTPSVLWAESSELRRDRPTEAGRAPTRDWWPVVWFGIGVVGGAHLLSDNSFLTHLATGRLILDGQVPHGDPYTFTAAGRPWVVQSWLFSLVDAGVEKLVGAWFLRLVLGVVMGLLLAAVWRLSRPARSVVGRVAVTAMAATVGLGYWNERPQTVAFLLLAVGLIVVVEQRNSWWLFPLFALWVNLHGSWPVGLVVVALVLVRRVIAERRVSVSETTAGALSLSGCVVGAALSPYGIDLLTFPLRLLGRSDVLRYIVEWQRPELLDPITLVLVAQVGLAAWVFRRDRSWGWVPLVVVMVGLVATGRRNLPLASLALVPVVAPAFSRLGSLRVGAALPPRMRAVAGMAIVLAAGVGVAAMPNDYDLGPYPTTAVDWMESHELVARDDVRVAHPDYVGNYLEWRYGAEAHAYLDDRAEVLDVELMSSYVEVLLSGKGDWREVLDRDRIDVVVWPAGKKLGRALSSAGDWRVAHRSTDGSGVAWVVACRAGSEIEVRCR
ncbi:MAG: hypothetical protein IT195_04725 [Microthrixaceae bacterium]|nr:hypothetical protein [Microthrixaceae bacterium]